MVMTPIFFLLTSDWLHYLQFWLELHPCAWIAEGGIIQFVEHR